MVLNRITKKMKELNMTQKELCEKLQLNPNTFIAWKKYRNNSYMKKLPEISKILGVSIEYLISGEEKEKTEADILFLKYKSQPEKIQKAIDILLS